MNLNAAVDELEKLGAISDQQARQSLDRLDTLERNKPSVKQVGRYAALGAVAGPTIGAVGNIINKKPAFGNLRHVAGEAAKGALGMGAVPLVRGHLDRQAEMGTLKKYMQQE